MTTTSDNDSNDPAGLEVMAVPKATLDKFLHHAAFAAYLVGHFDDDEHAELIGRLGHHIDAIVHGLTELLGDPRTLAAPDAAAPERAAHGSAPMLASGAGGAL